MEKWFLRVGSIVIASLTLSYVPAHVWDRLFATGFLATIYTVIGIMFPLGLNQIISFSFAEVERDAFVNRYRGDLDKIRNIFVCLFAVSTIVFLLQYFVDCAVQWRFVRFDLRCLYLAFMAFCLIYYIRNFIALAKLKNEIEDKIREAKKTRMPLPA